MKSFQFFGVLLALILGREIATGTVYFQLSVHNEQPHIPDTPTFTTDKTSYVEWRNAILTFAQMCQTRGLRWNCQMEWNFLEGTYKWEVDPATRDLTLLSGGKNVLQQLHDNYGVELDPHSHEGSGYTYADVAWLFTRCGTTASPVVGGHIYDPSDSLYQNWPKFLGAGIAATKYPAQAPNWQPVLLMGAGTSNHNNDPHVSGMWKPQDSTHYFTHSASQTIAAIGSWNQDLTEIRCLLDDVDRGTITAGGGILTAGITISQRDMVTSGYLAGTCATILDTIQAWQIEGRIETRQYMEMMSLWNGVPTIVQRPDQNLSFSLNWQDYARPSSSADRLARMLTMHESAGVPVDVFFTTWQTDLLETNAPELLGRLQSSAMVSQGYHVRAPKPYAYQFDWGAWKTGTMTTQEMKDSVTDYENHGLDLVTGMPTTASGGYTKLANLQGYSPLIVGSSSGSNTIQSAVTSAFSDMGALMMVSHNTPVDTGTSAYGLPYRPEHVDWKLIRVWEPMAEDPQPESLTAALLQARSLGGTTHPPYFVGVKVHDNDLFATQSWWTLVYPHAAANTNNWNPNQTPDALPDDEQSRRLTYYQNLVDEAALNRHTTNLLNVRGIISLISPATNPARPVGLSRTEIADGQAAGTVLCHLSGGGNTSGVKVGYSLVSGTGSEDNGDFTILNDQLKAANVFSSAAKRVRHLRVRWTDTTGSYGERALTVVVSPASPWQTPTITRAGDSSMHITARTLYGSSYTLKSSTNLIDWTDEDDAGCVGVVATASLTEFVDATPGAERKFYRVYLLP
jgi:hypothetical protein